MLTAPHTCPRPSVRVACACLFLATAASAADPVKYCRFEVAGKTAYGIVDGDRVSELAGDLFKSPKPTGASYKLSAVELLVPCEPRQVFAMAGNYRSHLAGENKVVTTVTTVTTLNSDLRTGETTSQTASTTETRRSDETPEKFQIPQPFLKATSCLVPQGADIVLPRDAGAVHYEAELVIVIGKRAKNVPKEKALEYVFGVTCGNDVSARVWQKADVQWWRAKGCDTFGPCGPFIVSGLNYDDLAMELRLNGEVRQKTRTSDLIHDVASQVSFISRHTTLEPGDLIYTGTPGETKELTPGDVCEIELEGVGVLRNKVVAGK